MAGYVACARIERASPHFVGAASGVDGSPPAWARLAWAAPTDQDSNRVEPVGLPPDERLSRWLAGVRETWSQTTFFLFDPESWR